MALSILNQIKLNNFPDHVSTKNNLYIATLDILNFLANPIKETVCHGGWSFLSILLPKYMRNFLAKV